MDLNDWFHDAMHGGSDGPSGDQLLVKVRITYHIRTDEFSKNNTPSEIIESATFITRFLMGEYIQMDLQRMLSDRYGKKISLSPSPVTYEIRNGSVIIDTFAQLSADDAQMVIQGIHDVVTTYAPPVLETLGIISSVDGTANFARWVVSRISDRFNKISNGKLDADRGDAKIEDKIDEMHEADSTDPTADRIIDVQVEAETPDLPQQPRQKAKGDWIRLGHNRHRGRHSRN